MNCNFKRCKFHNLQSIGNCSQFIEIDDVKFCISQKYCSAEIGERFNLLNDYDRLVRKDQLKNKVEESRIK